MILVTGGTGLVGSHLLFQLLDQELPIRAIFRRRHKLETVKKVFSYYSNTPNDLFDRIEWVEADLNDIPALQKAFEGVSHVYHSAAFVSFEPDRYRELRKINTEGTANIVNLCITNNVHKLCYVSSIAAIGEETNAETKITEQTEWNPELDHSVYAMTKYGAELEVWRGSQEGINTVIVNPGIILGPGFWKGGGSGSIFRKIQKGMSYYTKGSSAYVDVWDVVKVMTTLMASSISNERFIVISENLPFKDFQEKVAHALNVKPAHKLASPSLLGLIWRLDWLNNKFFGKRRKLSKQLANSLSGTTIYDNSKVRKALNFEFNQIDGSITKVCELYLKDLN
ncbi:NAD-dependent epimerase/dehydratase family protein [Psychroserpens sp.]|uniref:NAD-dependent epimerase/dehydratase family protein n=1 Tax=Psychroserpens sp. TaxID=2020870 RepID=UPI001B2D5690|nr:NAD-dependent epimerase/dehydratase family protein [Psychroserpens sp.]MBO6605652.1 NAD-dependent epimerase/dehydratase family protein [Psychroserpens sp.]MBO6631082.1 NAD-dependent epimerase/dehydratase family protein [Psychroserpens sp.]MBO6652977.1 NAD-dependent epimerase/dehydratase family protein [Psychroserpens sp.]MBO6681251.1 NAD-dependent epimerase/dehydratase family protein [Psychroserpens sp.]MBO6749026.1 NAD-dependent epimerase/dehydratase family protein [Psychroserpens sp.]